MNKEDIKKWLIEKDINPGQLSFLISQYGVESLYIMMHDCYKELSRDKWLDPKNVKP